MRWLPTGRPASPPRSLGLLATRAISDDALQYALGQRPDVPDDLLITLSKAAQASAQRRMNSKTATPPPVLPPKIKDEAEFQLAADVTARAEDIAGLAKSGELTEAKLAAYGEEGDKARAIAALAFMARLSEHAARMVITGLDRDAVVIVGKAMGWSWATVRALGKLRPENEQSSHMVQRAKQSYETLKPETAERVLQFIRVKEQTKPAA